MAKGSLIILGSGPGIGATTAAHFAAHGFSAIALLARSAARLPADAQTVAAANPSATVKTYAVDIGDAGALKSTLEQTAADLGPPEVVLFNAARIAVVELGVEPPASLLADFQVMNIGLYVAISWAQPHLVKLAADDAGAHPTFLLSGSSIGKNGQPPVFALSMQKAAQHNLLQSLQKLVGPRGVHVADVLIEGEVTDADPVINAKNIAATNWALYCEEPAQWRFETEIGTMPPFTPARKE